MTEKACRNCHMITPGSVCPVCKTSSLSSDWAGYVIILDPANSAIAQKLNISAPGKYALRVR